MTPALSRLSPDQWDDAAYDRPELPERVLQFGTGMLLRALLDALLDAVNRRGAFRGRVVVVQSTAHGAAGTLNAQGGLFTIVERDSEDGARDSLGMRSDAGPDAPGVDRALAAVSRAARRRRDARRLSRVRRLAGDERLTIH